VRRRALWLLACLPLLAQESKWSYKPEDLWAFQPLRRVQGSIDSFLPSGAPADRVTLLRRVTFDLTGLPPTPEEVDAFVRDPAPDAFRKVVERLLGSARYGERWARHWLDVVRYADSDGYSNDYERPNAWRYRDYVIRSFNQDKPYDRFLLEQIAGDELDPANSENLIAAGFLRMGPWEHTSMSVAAVTRQAFLDDVTHSTATVFLGLTAGCARCHDHKFDPLPTREYYRLQAVFASTQFEQSPAPWMLGENQPEFANQAFRIHELVRRNEARLAELRELARARGGNEKTLTKLTPGEFERSKVYRKRLELYQRELRRYQPLAYSVASKGAPDTFVLQGGALGSTGEKVTPGVFAVAYRFTTGQRPVPQDLPVTSGGRRLALARWIADPANPLTARVMVNRIWQYHFGRGLAANPNNLGKMGQKPTYPELLDWLASEFVASGWSVKHMHRLIVLSAAYQRGDFPPRRLEAEEIRDAILAVSGELSPDTGGPGTFPEINDDVALQPRLIMGTIAPVYTPSALRRQRNRRTIYTYQKRSVIDPLVEAFNGASLTESCERRESTIVPTQAFTLLHSRFSRDMALAFAVRLESEAAGREARIDRAIRLAFSRLPATEERAKALAYLGRMTAWHQDHEPPKPQPRRPVVRTMVTEQSGEPVEVEEEDNPVEYETNLHPSQLGPETRALADLPGLRSRSASSFSRAAWMTCASIGGRSARAPTTLPLYTTSIPAICSAATRPSGRGWPTAWERRTGTCRLSWSCPTCSTRRAARPTGRAASCPPTTRAPRSAPRARPSWTCFRRKALLRIIRATL